MSKIKVKIAGIDPHDSSALILKVNGVKESELKVNPDDVIVWKVGAKSGVQFVLNIFADKDSNNVFCKGPERRKMTMDSKWIGTIGPYNEDKANEHYTIEFTKKNDLTIYEFDPKIAVNPG